MDAFTDNLWLATLRPVDQKRLAPHLKETPFDPGLMLYDIGEAVDAIWFPLHGVVSLMTDLGEGRAVETAAIGREGLVGVTCGPMNGRAATRAVCQIEGVAACCPAAVFADLLYHSAPMRVALSRFTEGLMAQVQQAAACNAQHRLDQRLARWLLTTHDRTDNDRLDLTQADVADMLGVRRATVSEVSAELEGRGLIRRGRGWVCVTDRKALEGAACGCYALMRGVMADLGLPQTVEA
mgnify:FL=1|jgi:CRP-like cAMP-binding protein